MIGDTLKPTGRAVLRLPPAEGNKTEQEYGLRLFSMEHRKEIRCYRYEPVKLKLAKKCFYCPDFFVWENDRTITVHEVKGWWRDDARVKIKVAARLYPMLQFLAVTKDGHGGWTFEYIS
jgi:predicted nuclease of restriction endonuclease-like RecB superfamily